MIGKQKRRFWNSCGMGLIELCVFDIFFERVRMDVTELTEREQLSLLDELSLD